MSGSEAMPGKKVKLEVHADDAAVLREKGMDFFKAMQGKTVSSEKKVLYGDVLLGVAATKPKGLVEIGKKTAIKMSITKEPLLLTCPHCGQAQDTPQENCAGCGGELPVVSI